jgi:calpain-15
VSSHAYALISVHNPLTDEGRVQLLRLRNPWGSTEWQGDWSDKSDKWTPALKKELGWSDADDGMFFIPFDDYLNFYTSTTICKVHDNYHYNSVSTKQEKDSHTFFTFELDDDSYIDLTVSQVAERMVNKKYGYKCSQVKMILARINEGESPMFEYIDGTKGDDNDVTMDLEEHLPAGKYVCFVEIDWLFSEQMKKFSFNTYSEIEIHV